MIVSRLLRRTSIALSLAALASCAQPAYVPGDVAGPPLPDAEYRQAARGGIPVYRIDTQRSRIYMRVGRDGPMKSAGHDHLIASEDIEGLVLLSEDSAASRADLRLPLQRLIVDDPEYRSRFGLEADLSESAINGTTRNMQDKVLESGTYPWATASASIASASDERVTLAVSITLHGTAFEYIVPAELEVRPDRLSVAGKMTIQHGDFGLTPYSAAGGLLRVAEHIDIEFELSAERLDTSRNLQEIS